MHTHPVLLYAQPRTHPRTRSRSVGSPFNPPACALHASSLLHPALTSGEGRVRRTARTRARTRARSRSAPGSLRPRRCAHRHGRLTGLGRRESLAFALGFGLLLGLDGRYDLLDLGGFEVLQGKEQIGCRSNDHGRDQWEG
jgi:hypothetical protein